MKNKQMRSILVLALAALLLTVAVSGTLAYLVDMTEAVRNTFEPTRVSVTVKDTATGMTKSDVIITNTSNVKAYIRAAIVANWQDANNVVIAGWNDYDSISLGTNWKRHTDGYYYYTQPVDANTNVPSKLFTSYTYDSANKGVPPDVYGNPADHLQMDILVQAIQADGTDAASGEKPVKLAWGVDPSTLGQ